MIKDISSTRDGDLITVNVECSIREYASYPIKVLTTSEVISIIEKEYNITIEKVVEEPKTKVGNSNIKKITNCGIWRLQAKKRRQVKRNTRTQKKTTSTSREKNKKEELDKVEDPPKPTTKKKPNIRSRMSKLSKKN